MRQLIRPILLASLLFGLAATIASAQASDEQMVKLELGQIAPEFSATDDEGRIWKSVDHVGSKFLVVYFYPGDFTPGCTRQAQSFRDNMNQLSDRGVEVIGISGDGAATHALFRKAQKLNFTLLADEDGSLAKSFGVPTKSGAEVKAKDVDGNSLVIKRAITTSRWTFIIGKDGKVLYKNKNVNPVQDSKEVATFIDKLEMK